MKVHLPGVIQLGMFRDLIEVTSCASSVSHGPHRLRIYSLIPLALAFLFARSLHSKRHFFIQASRVTELSIRLLRLHPPLLLLSPVLLFASMLLSIPFLSLLFRLFLIGYVAKEDPSVWHIRAYAGWIIGAVLLVWVWSWFIARGVLRCVSASVIGAWYFKRYIIPCTPLERFSVAFSSRESFSDPSLTVQYALGRAGGPSLGTLCFASFVLSVTQSLILVLRCLRRVRFYSALLQARTERDIAANLSFIHAQFFTSSLYPNISGTDYNGLSLDVCGSLCRSHR